MANIFFRAKYLWDYQSREQGFSLINDYLANQIGQTVFQDTLLLIGETKSGQIRNFYTDLYLLITQYRSADVSFCRLFSLIWELNPHQRWINILLELDLYSDLYIKKAPDIDKRNAEIELISDLLVRDATNGILGSDSNEYPLIRRAILPMNTIQFVDDWQWRSLKSNLIHRLPNAYSLCPSDFWIMRSSIEADIFFIHFLQDIFLDLSIEISEIRWKTITQHYQSYADTMRQVVKGFLTQGNEPYWLKDVALLDAGFTGVENDLKWLNLLYESLCKNNFSPLSYYTHLDPKT